MVDVFGYSKERKAERALIKIYEQDLQAVLENLVDDNAVAAIELLSRVDQVRGFGPVKEKALACLLYTSPSPRDRQKSRMPSSA